MAGPRKAARGGRKPPRPRSCEDPAQWVALVLAEVERQIAESHDPGRQRREIRALLSHGRIPHEIDTYIALASAKPGSPPHGRLLLGLFYAAEKTGLPQDPRLAAYIEGARMLYSGARDRLKNPRRALQRALGLLRASAGRPADPSLLSDEEYLQDRILPQVKLRMDDGLSETKAIEAVADKIGVDARTLTKALRKGRGSRPATGSTASFEGWAGAPGFEGPRAPAFASVPEHTRDDRGVDARAIERIAKPRQPKKK